MPYQSTISILIFGLGNVSVGYDLQDGTTGKASHIFSLFGLATKSSVNLDFYAVDINTSTHKPISTLFPSIHIFDSLDDVPRLFFDIILICTPIPTLGDLTIEVIRKFKFRQLLIEKPGAHSANKASELNTALATVELPSILFSKRALPSSIFLQNQIKKFPRADWKVQINYSGSPENILSHFVDLLDFLFSVDTSKSVFEVAEISLCQTSTVNQGDHEILIEGPISINYRLGGKFVTIISADGALQSFDFTDEVNSQIWYTAKAYFGTALSPGMPTSPFPNRISASIQEILAGKRF
jgi:hypothetical protein